MISCAPCIVHCNLLWYCSEQVFYNQYFDKKNLSKTKANYICRIFQIVQNQTIFIQNITKNSIIVLLFLSEMVLLQFAFLCSSATGNNASIAILHFFKILQNGMFQNLKQRMIMFCNTYNAQYFILLSFSYHCFKLLLHYI